MCYIDHDNHSLPHITTYDVFCIHQHCNKLTCQGVWRIPLKHHSFVSTKKKDTIYYLWLVIHIIKNEGYNVRQGYRHGIFCTSQSTCFNFFWTSLFWFGFCVTQWTTKNLDSDQVIIRVTIHLLIHELLLEEYKTQWESI